MKRIILFIVFTIFLITLTSAFDFDNVKSYDTQQKQITVTNAFGIPFISEDIATIKLTSEQNVYVGTGQDVQVAEFELSSYDKNYNEALKTIELYNIKSGMKPIERALTYKYEKIIITDIPEYNKICSPITITNLNGTKQNTQDCSYVKAGNKIQTEWIPFTSLTELPEGNVRVGIFTDVYEGDSVEWIPTFFGVRIDEWSSWTASLNANLTYYYNLNQVIGTSGTENVAGVKNITSWIANWTSGRIGNGHYGTSGDNGNTGINLSQFGNNWSMNFWVNSTGNGVGNGRIMDAGSGVSDFFVAGAGNPQTIGLRFNDTNFVGVASGNNGVWDMITVTRNVTGYTLYVNGTEKQHIVTIPANKRFVGDIFCIFNGGSTCLSEVSSINVVLDELGFWNRTLSSSEVTQLYNEGAGITYSGNPSDIGNIDVTLNNPPNSVSSANSSYNFTATATPFFTNITNATLYIYKGTTLINKTANQSFNSQLDGVNTSSIQLTGLGIGSYNWNTLFCGNNLSLIGVCNFSSSNFTLNIAQSIDGEYYRNGSEGENAFFQLNLTVPGGSVITIPQLYYNNTLYTGTSTLISGNQYKLERTITLPNVNTNTNINFNWTITYSSGDNFNSTSRVNTVSPINLSICGALPQNIPYINFTFKNELTLTTLNATIVNSLWNYWIGTGSVTRTLSYLDTNEIPSYAFCFTPADKTLAQDTLVQYSSTGYPQRRFFSTSNLTNSTSNQTLYLLSSSDGIYSTIQVVNIVGTAIQGATVVLEKNIAGNFVVIGSETTDGSGTVTFWVDPNSDNRLTVSKSGYVTSQQTVRLTQTIYTITLSSGTSANATYTSDLEGIKWLFRPSVGIVQENITTSFNVTINASKNNLVSCEFRLTNSTSNISSTTSSCSSSGGFLNLNYAVHRNEKVIGVFSINLGNGSFILDADAIWVGHDQNISQARTLKGIIQSLNNLNEFGEGVEQEFSKIVFFFIALTIILGLICFFSGYDFSHPGFVSTLLVLIILFFTISGWFRFDGLIKNSIITFGDSGQQIRNILDQWIYFIIVLSWWMAFMFNFWRRNYS